MDTPAIGSQLDGGMFAGKTLKDGKAIDLVLLPGEFKGDWKAAGVWAIAQGGVLPSRFDHIVLFDNLRSEFRAAWYWSAEAHPTHADYARFHSFGDNEQGGCHDGTKLLARAVRRVAS